MSKNNSKPSDQEIKERLSDIQYKVTQKDGTEKPFKNEYWDNEAQGIYVDIVSGEPLFSSKDKEDSMVSKRSSIFFSFFSLFIVE